jgi:hypothetical protein
VAGKFIFRSKKIGGSRKLNWWLRNFRPGKMFEMCIEETDFQEEINPGFSLSSEDVLELKN